MARKRSSKINIENYVNGSPITPGVTYKLGDADTHTAWLLAFSSPCLFKLSATAPTDELWSNITPEQFIINGSVAGQVIEIASPNGKYFVVPTNAQDKNASVESAHATIALHPLGFNYDQEYQALPLDGDGPVSEGFYKISNLESGKLYSINVHPDLGGLMETKPNPEFSYALFSVGADNNPKAFLAGGKTTDQLVFVATETSAILSLGSTIEEAGYFVSIRNFSLGSGEGGGSGTGFDPASEANILTTNAFLNTTTITKTGTSTVTQTVPYHLASIKVPPGTHSTIQANFEVSNHPWNYSSFSGFSFIWRATGAAKLTFGIGRGAKTVRSDLSIDSYSIIPANDLAYNHGEILDITFDNVRDTQRNGYMVRVREIYALDSTAGWQVKTTTSFIPATNNEPIPWTIAKVIYQQNASANIAQYDNLGALWLMLTGGQANNLYKIATCRGVSTFETGVGISHWVTDVVNNSTGNISVNAGNGEYTYYQPGGTNPVFYGLEAMAVDAIESEEATDFVDINNPIEQA